MDGPSAASDKLEIHLNQFKPLAGRSFIPLPQKLTQKKAIINVRNEDDRCFQWAVLSALHNKEVDRKSANRVTQYKQWAGELNFDGIEFPVSLKAIDKFERQNANLNINVFGYDGVKKGEDGEEDLQVYPLRISENTGTKHIDLLVFNQYRQAALLLDQEPFTPSDFSSDRTHRVRILLPQVSVPFHQTGYSGENIWNIAARRRRSKSRCRKKEPSSASETTNAR